ncbi:MAG: oligosaccharide flippase family protein [Novosphingobium sp.]|nr:oligosaccharide flippase family protein [Novosphingobium sp.]
MTSIFRNAPQAVVTVMQNFSWMLASRILAAVFSLIYLAIITRTLGVSGFGRFALITGAAQLLSNLLAFQTWQIIIQYGVNHIENDDETRLSRLYRSAVLLDAISVVIGIAAGALILHLFAEALGMKPTLARATLIFNIIMLLAMRSTPLGILRLRDRFSLAAAADSTLPSLRLFGAIVVTFVHPSLQGYLIAWAIAELLSAAAHWYAVHRIGDFGLLFRNGRNVSKVFADNPGISRYAWTSNFSQSLYVSAKQIPLFLAGGLTGTAAAGAFSLASQLARSLTMVAQLVSRAAFPEIVRAVRKQGLGGLGGMIWQSLRTATAVSIVVFLIAVLLGGFVLEAVGGVQFASTYYILLWLTAAACVDLATVTFEPSIMAAHRAHLAFMAKLAATAMMIGAALFLEPIMGANGVAAAVLVNSGCTAILLGMILAYLVRRGTADPKPMIAN